MKNNTKDSLSDFQLLATTVRRIKINNSFLEFDMKDDSVQRSLDLSYRVVKESNYDVNNRIGVLDLQIVVSYSKAEEHFDVDMTIRGICGAPIDMGDDQFNKMLRVNGCSALYSVARGIICSTSAQMLLGGSILLPLVNFVHFQEADKADDEQ